MIGTLITLAITAVKVAVSVVTAALPKIGAAVMNLITKIPQNLWRPLIELTSNVVKNISGINDSACEIGEKARVAAEKKVKPEDFKSTTDYLKHLQDKIEIDREKLNNMSPEERMARELTGAALFTQSIEEKCGLKLPAEVLRTLSKIAMPAGQFLILAEKLKKSELTMDDVVSYLDEKCPGSKIADVDALLKDAVTLFLGDKATRDAVNQSILDMIDRNKQVEA